MTNHPPKKPRTPIWGSLVFMALYALGIWHNASSGNTAFLILWSLLFVVNGIFLIIRLKQAVSKK